MLWDTPVHTTSQLEVSNQKLLCAPRQLLPRLPLVLSLCQNFELVFSGRRARLSPNDILSIRVVVVAYFQYKL